MPLNPGNTDESTGSLPTYLDVLRKAKSMENDAISIGLQLLSLAPPEDIAQLAEITGDENDHDRIYTTLLQRYEAEPAETGGE